MARLVNAPTQVCESVIVLPASLRRSLIFWRPFRQHPDAAVLVHGREPLSQRFVVVDGLAEQFLRNLLLVALRISCNSYARRGRASVLYCRFDKRDIRDLGGLRRCLPVTLYTYSPTETQASAGSECRATSPVVSSWSRCLSAILPTMRSG